MFVGEYALGEPITDEARRIAAEHARADATAYLIDQGSPVTSEAQQIVADTLFFARELPVAQKAVQAENIREVERLSPEALFQQPALSRYAFLMGTRFLTALGLKNFYLKEPPSLDNRANNNLSNNDVDLRRRDDVDFRDTAIVISSFVSSSYNSFGTSSSLLTLFAAAKSQVFGRLEEFVSSTASIISNFKDAAIQAGDRVREWIGDKVDNVLASLPRARSIIARELKAFRDAGNDLSNYVRAEFGEARSNVGELLRELRHAGLNLLSPEARVSIRPAPAAARGYHISPT